MTPGVKTLLIMGGLFLLVWMFNYIKNRRRTPTIPISAPQTPASGADSPPPSAVEKAKPSAVPPTSEAGWWGLLKTVVVWILVIVGAGVAYIYLLSPLVHQTQVVRLQPNPPVEVVVPEGCHDQPDFSFESGSVRITPLGRAVGGKVYPDGIWRGDREEGPVLVLQAGDRTPRIPAPSDYPNSPWEIYSITSTEEVLVEVTFAKKWWPL